VGVVGHVCKSTGGQRRHLGPWLSSLEAFARVGASGSICWERVLAGLVYG